MKVCSLCKTEKSLEAFGKRAASKDGLQSKCKECDRAKTAEWRKANPDHRRKYYAANSDRERAGMQAWREANSDSVKRYSQNYHKANVASRKKYNAEWYKLNAEREKLRMRKWVKANRPIMAAIENKRRAAKLQATPAWADHKAIALIYEEAQFATEFFGVPFQVDHIIPLQSDLVCGLHWEQNLQVLQAGANLQKSNLWWPDGPMTV